ncbi:uncharacterized protein LOC124661704 isoform X2 [Lolium rigidum]|uniref:uncharacterized protein LOC124661704 isoform X2 n=1 Tax=Lolium rigidum TaxID=89674 RepID=UPI001F5DEF57|nr:uncharacterized protein LOC124661704 isoform X2 [Lolium rigidum]
MDLDDDDFELPARTCPPVGSRNTGKNKPEEDLHNHCCTDKRPLKKRKTITKMAQNRDAKIKQAKMSVSSSASSCDDDTDSNQQRVLIQ